MNLSAQAWMELSFNVSYLIVVWGLVGAMLRRQAGLPPAQRRLRTLFILAFALLALGDTGHVGFRAMAYARGGLGTGAGLVGLGALATAITVTFFYAIMLWIWKERFARPWGWPAALLLAAAAVRLAVMAFPQNQWHLTVPPQPWSLYRNLPLMVQGLGVAWLILRDARAAHDRAFAWIGGMIVASYAFYAPVILWVQVRPAIGMLMIPKTLAYVAIAVIAFRHLFRRPTHAPEGGHGP